ncbi:MAG: GNAT family N-acetyltransferase [Planctomycetota bacterium JB042]
MTRDPIRPALPEDLRLLPGIERAAAARFPDHVLSAEARAAVQSFEALEAARADGRLWVAVSGRGAPVGFAIAEVADGVGFLVEVDVHPDHQGRGLGRALVETVVDWARREGLPAVTLTTFASLPWNAPFYERLGFRRLAGAERGERLAALLRDEARRGLRDRVAMRLDLGGRVA